MNEPRKQLAEGHENERRRRVRRTAIILGLIAFAFYAGFILMAVVRHSS